MNIPIPTRLIFSKASVKIYLKLARMFSSRAARYIPEGMDHKAERILDNLPENAICALCDEIVRVKKKHGSWELVEVRSASGDEVKITL